MLTTSALLLLMVTAAWAGDPTSVDTAYGNYTIYFKVKRGTDAAGAFARLAASAKFATVGGLDVKLTEKTPLPSALGGVLNLGDAPKPPEDSLEDTGKDITAADRITLKEADRAFSLAFAAKPEAALEGAHAADQLVLALAQELDGIIWDSAQYLLIPRAVWERRVVGSWKGGVPQVREHINIHVREAGDLLRACSRGMDKFGLPDLVVDQFPKSVSDAVGSLLNRVAQALVEGRRPVADGAFLVTDGARGTKVWLAETARQDNDPENRLVAIRVQGKGTPPENLMQALTELLGAKDAATAVDPDGAAREKARARLPEIAARFRAGLAVGERILVKAPFAAPDGRREWMWLEVTRWDGDAIDGLLQNKPVLVTGLNAGARVRARQPEIADWAHVHADGTRESDGPGER